MSELSIRVRDSIEAVDEKQWNHVVEQSDRGTIYHRTGWIRAVESSLKLDGKHVIVEKSGSPIGVFPNVFTDVRLPSGVSRQLPDSVTDTLTELSSLQPGFGGPVFQSDETAALDRSLDELERACGPTTLSHYVRVPQSSYVRYAEHFEARGYRPSVSRCRFTVDLEREYEDIVAAMDKDRRYNLRKARENDAEVVVEPLTTSTIREFYDVYESAMERVGSEPQPFALFEQLVAFFDDSIRIVSVEIDGEIVGRHFYLLDHDQATIRHEFSAVSAENFEYYPSELIHEHMMQWGQAEGYRTYDFGATPSNHEDGLFSYKNQYGGSVRPVLTWERGQSPLWRVYSLARRRYKRRN